MKRVVFVIKVMGMGGAERIMSELANYCAYQGWRATVILTSQSICNANLSRLNGNVEVLSVADEIKNERRHTVQANSRMFFAHIEGKLSCALGNKWKDASSIQKYYSRNYEKLWWLKRYFSANRNSTVIAFMYDSIFLTLLTATKTNRVIISDRGDPQQSVSSRTDMAFFRRMFPKADHMVYQSPGVQEWYKTNIGLDGTVIFNPIKDNLPQPYCGERKHEIVNFCRLSPQKNLFLLLESFEKLAEEFLDYELHIFGDFDEAEKEYGERFLMDTQISKFADRIKVFPAQTDIHKVVFDAAMFVSSSDFEGMSNSMLEAMAIGLPTICTDCPAGGARAVIKDHENGLLVPVGDANALYLAMKELIENPGLSEKLSQNGRKIRQEQSSEIIMKQWKEIING